MCDMFWENDILAVEKLDRQISSVVSINELEGVIKKMWGICFDTIVCEGKTLPSGLFQCVVEYEICIDSTTANLVYPVEGVQIAVDKLRALDKPPQFMNGDLVSPVNHPDMVGVIRGIGWHFENQDYMYFISVNGRKKSKRYYDKDLIKR